MSQLIYCVTGKMAAGKNYICEQFKKQGWTSLDADILVHDAIDMAKDKILSTFEPYAKEKNIKLKKDSDGSIDRRALGELLFSMPNLLKIQESIVYTIITEQIKKYIEEHPQENIIINATVLYKTPELMNLCQKILYVQAPFHIRLYRARNRDNLPFNNILKRFYTQKNLLKEYKKTGIPLEIIKN